MLIYIAKTADRKKWFFDQSRQKPPKGGLNKRRKNSPLNWESLKAKSQSRSDLYAALVHKPSTSNCS